MRTYARTYDYYALSTNVHKHERHEFYIRASGRALVASIISIYSQCESHTSTKLCSGSTVLFQITILVLEVIYIFLTACARSCLDQGLQPNLSHCLFVPHLKILMFERR